MRKKTIKEVSGICIASAGLYLCLRYIIKIDFQPVLVFVSFFIMPAVIICILKKPIAVGRFDKTFFLSMSAYIVLLLWVLLYYPSKKDFFSEYRILNWAFVSWLFFTALNVMPVDFFTKRIIQFEVAKEFGEAAGLFTQNIAWIVGHVYEIFWLDELMGLEGAVLFIIFSGFLTGLVYAKTKNTLGLMFGHWLMNLAVAVFVSLL